MYAQQLIDEFHSTARSCADKDILELTESEKFALCFVAGVPIVSEMKDNIMKLRTKVPCGVVKIEGQFRVACASSVARVA